MTWTGQTFSVGQILTAAQMNNLQADITAQANGDSGAPKQQTAGIADAAITPIKLAAPATGSYRPDTMGAGGSTSSTSYAKVGDIYCPRAGTFSVSLTVNFSAGKGGSSTAYARIYVDGVATGTERSTTSSLTVAEDITVTAGQTIQIYAKVNNVVDTSTALINLRVASGSLTFPAALDT